MSRIHVNNFASRLASGITSLATSMTLQDSIPGTLGSNTISLTLYNSTYVEIIKISSYSGAPTYTIARAQEGTTARAWPADTTVQCRLTAGSVDSIPVTPVTLIYANNSISAASSVDITDIGDYSMVKFILTNFIPATDGAYLNIRTSSNNGTSYDSGASDYRWQYLYRTTSALSSTGTSQNNSFITLTSSTGSGNDVGESTCAEITLYAPANSSVHSKLSWEVIYNWTDGSIVRVDGSGSRKANAITNAVRILFSAGNITSGKIEVYGFNRS